MTSRFVAIACIVIMGIAIALAATVRKAGAEPRVDAAIVFLADVSSSIDGNELEIMRGSHAYALTSSEFLNAVENGLFQKVAITYMEFANDAEVILDWTIIDGKASAEQAAAAIQGSERPFVGSNTAIGTALFEANMQFKRLPYEPLKQVVDIAGDGMNNAGAVPGIARDVLVSNGVVINALPMLLKPDVCCGYTDLTEYFVKEVVGGVGASVFPLNTIQDMPMTLRQKLVYELF